MILKMDVNCLLALIATFPWLWIIVKSIISWHILDFIPLMILVSLLVALKHTIRREQQDKKNTKESDKKVRVDAFSQTALLHYYDQAVQVEHEKSDAFTQVELKQFLDEATQTVMITKDESTGMDASEMSTTGTQTSNLVMNDKEVQTVSQVCKDQESPTTSCSVTDNEVQTEAIPLPTKVFVPVKPPTPKATIPLTKQFLTHHRWRHVKKRQKMKFTPTLDDIQEVDEQIKEPELDDESKSHDLITGGNDIGENNSVQLSLESNQISNDIHSRNEKEMGCRRRKMQEKPMLECLSEANEHDNESKLQDTPPPESEIHKAFVEKEVTELIHHENASLDDSFSNDLHSTEEDETKTTKKKKPSFFKKKFKNLRKLFKK